MLARKQKKSQPSCPRKWIGSKNLRGQIGPRLWGSSTPGEEKTGYKTNRSERLQGAGADLGLRGSGRKKKV